MSDPEEVSRMIIGIHLRLETLASINASNILAPGWPPTRYHRIIEEAYATLKLVETQIDTLRAELDDQHKRLVKMRDVMLASENQQI